MFLLYVGNVNKFKKSYLYAMKPFLILQLRPNDMASDHEFSAFLQYGELTAHDVHRVRMEKEGIPEINLNDYSGIVIGGGPSNVSDKEENKYEYQKRFEAALDRLLDKVFAVDFPILGTCYGIGALNKHQGGVVSKEKYFEAVGGLEIELTEAGKKDELLAGIPAKFMAFGGHKEACQSIPNSAMVLAKSDNCPVQMIRFGQNMYATQFHTELDEEGIALRINIYKNHGYFSPEDAETLIENSKKYHVTIPSMIFKQFVERYRH
jgi:GMP synthase (glutamine-hydrolysing)